MPFYQESWCRNGGAYANSSAEGVEKKGHRVLVQCASWTHESQENGFNFYWPGIHQDVERFCRSCDVCQRTVPKAFVAKVPLGKILLIDLPFKHVAVNLISPITQASDKEHQYVLTPVDYATRYPEPVTLKNIDTEIVEEALLDLYNRVRIAKVLSDLGI